MSNHIYAFILTSIAGISTLIGYLFIYIKNDRESIISKALGFASGVMITISISDLLPNSSFLLSNKYNKLNTYIVILFAIFIGFLISEIINNRVENNTKNNIKLYKLGIISMIVIMLHNIPEGIATYITTTNNIKLGLTLAIAIALHNIPEGISISIPIYYSTNSKLKAFIYTFISGMSELIGAIISYLFLSKYINQSILGIIYSIIAGMMLSIGYLELYRESVKYNKKNTNIYFILGTIVMILNHIILD